MEKIKLAVSILHIILAIAMIIVILLQSSKRTGLSGSIAGASETFFGKNQSRTIDSLLGKLTSAAAILFLCTSLFLAYNFAIIKSNPSTNQNGKAPITAPSGAPASTGATSKTVPQNAAPAASGAPAKSAPAANGAPVSSAPAR